MSYLVLPSNSSITFFPNNKPGHFFTKLPKALDFSDEYEVGLSEILFSNTYSNILENEMSFTFRVNSAQEPQTVLIPSGLYESVAQLVSVMVQKVQSKMNKKHIGQIKIYYNIVTRKVTIRVYKAHGLVRLNAALTKLLKFDRQLILGHTANSSTGPVELNTGSEAVYVYCDLVQPRVVGDSCVPLLRCVPSGNKTSDIVHHIFEKPNYIPLRIFRFDTVEILLTNDKKKSLSFDSGTL